MEKHFPRMTRQRRAILETLTGMDSHPTADDLYSVIREKMPRISLGTVYRNLDALSCAGIVRRIDADGAQRRFDGNMTPHYHARCVGCGKVMDVHVKTSVDLKEVARALGNFRLLGHRLEFVGLCPDCTGNTKTVDGETFPGTQDGRKHPSR